jgi:hypothetical protein
MAQIAREQILNAVNAITHGGHRTFTTAEVVAELRRRGTEIADSTIRTHVSSRMCANAPKNHAITYDDFVRVGHGEYRLRERSAVGDT